MAENEGTTTTTTTDAGKGGTTTQAGKGTTATDDAGKSAGGNGSGGGQATTGTSTTEDPSALIERLRTENREAKREAAALRAKASKLDELEEASKTEQQKALDRATAAEKAATEATTKLLRYEVAAAKGVPAKLAGRLQGDTREEMEADADDLLATLNAGGAGGQPRRTSGNARDEGGAPAGDMNTALRRMFGRPA